LEVQKKLLKNLAVSRSQVEETAQAKEKAKSSLDIAEHQLQIVKEKLDSTSVRSPMEGIVLKDFTKMGDKISPGKEIITVGDVSRFIIRAKVDELDIQQIHQGQKVIITADAYPGQMMQGIVTTIATQAERDTFAKIEVVIDITDPAKVPLKHNLSVRAHIVTEDIPKAVGVPVKAVVRKKGDRGWIVVKSLFNMVREKEVCLGRVAGDEIEITSGLKSGAHVGIEKAEEPS
jgi:HlyD family secretion protein